jgi:hypothetical protein
MNQTLQTQLQQLIDFEKVIKLETIQSLWSGYGSLVRVFLSGYEQPSVIIKHINPPVLARHPRGWNSNAGHQRKLTSYEVEAAWYQTFNKRTNHDCRTARLLAFKQMNGGSLLVLEDLSAAGFPLRKSHLSDQEIKGCLSWLAAFHAQFMQEKPRDLWPVGTYWHLNTRQHEYEAMPASVLKSKASEIDTVLNNCNYQTIVHGDAKYANFCFSVTGKVAAVDFQYIGGGCGMKDVAYLLSCIEGGIASKEREAVFLNHYFSILKAKLSVSNPNIEFNKLEIEWRQLYPVAWADFERFLQGWAPGHWKISNYSEQMVRQALDHLK